jgi:hypothetical protein
MKTLVFNETNVSAYLFQDSESLQIQSNQIVVGDPVRFVVGDCNESNVSLFENVTGPDDWVGGKYLYTQNDGWTLNSEWTAPEPSETP